MGKRNSDDDKSVLAIIGGLIMGVGAGLFFFPQSVFGVPSVFAFVGCILGGFGIGLLVAALMTAKGRAV